MLWMILMVILIWWMLSMMGNVSNLELLEERSSIQRRINDRYRGNTLDG